MKSTTKLKLNYYYIPKKSQYKLTIVESVEPVIPIAIDNDFMIDLLFHFLDPEDTANKI